MSDPPGAVPRTLAEILAEAGIQAGHSAGGRRRKPEPPAAVEPAPEPEPELMPDPDPEPERVPEPEPEPGLAPAGHGGRSIAMLAWARFAGELVLAVVAGSAVWYVFSLLWDLYPYVAAVAAPIALTGLVIGTQLVRRRRQRTSLGTGSLALVLLVASFLVIVPAATVLTRR